MYLYCMKQKQITIRVLKNDIKAYLYDESQFNKVCERINNDANDIEYVEKQKEYADMWLKKLESIVNAVTKSYGITADQFIGMVCEYDQV